MNTPKVSIGMPVYNGEHFIREALDSLLAQTFTDFELIISDNASTDDTEEICQNYASKDSRIRYIRQSKNLGASCNFEFVLDEAVGEYFMWAAHDDKWDKEWIEKLQQKLLNNNTNFVFGRLLQIGETGDTIPYRTNHRKFNFIGNKTLRKAFFFLEPEQLGKSNSIYGLYKKSFLPLKKLSIFLSPSETITEWNDIFFLYNILSYTELHCVPDVFFYKRLVISTFTFRKQKRISHRLLNALQKTIYNNSLYYTWSSLPEKALITFLVPIKVIWTFWTLFVR